MTRVGVTGGIGSGKSTVCALFAELGIPAYDSDSRARELMNGGGVGVADASGSGKLRQAIVGLLGVEAYRNGMLDSAYVAGRVFADSMLLSSLNAIVHPAVAEDFEAWALSHTAGPYIILESAILFESGFDRFVKKVVTVSAPENVRLERVLGRGGTGVSRQDILERMANQLPDGEREQRADWTIDNSGTIGELAACVEQLDKLLRQ